MKENLIQLEAIINTMKAIKEGTCNTPSDLARERLTYDLAGLIKAIAKLAYDIELEKYIYKQWEAIMTICEGMQYLPLRK